MGLVLGCSSEIRKFYKLEHTFFESLQQTHLVAKSELDFVTEIIFFIHCSEEPSVLFTAEILVFEDGLCSRPPRETAHCMTASFGSSKRADSSELQGTPSPGS